MRKLITAYKKNAELIAANDEKHKLIAAYEENAKLIAANAEKDKLIAAAAKKNLLLILENIGEFRKKKFYSSVTKGKKNN